MQQIKTLPRSGFPFIVLIESPESSHTSILKNHSEILPVVDHPFIKKLTVLLEKKHADASFRVPELCQTLFLCPMQVHRKIKKLTGLSPGKYLSFYRLQKAKLLLGNSDLTIGEIAWQTGFASPHHFTRAYRRVFGKPPRDARMQ